MRDMPEVKWRGMPNYDNYDNYVGYHFTIHPDEANNIESWMWEAKEYIKYLEGLI